jgi:antitoxin component YwqK of YwqJK toxin-antitoxin module
MTESTELFSDCTIMTKSTELFNDSTIITKSTELFNDSTIMTESTNLVSNLQQIIKQINENIKENIKESNLLFSKGMIIFKTTQNLKKKKCSIVGLEKQKMYINCKYQYNLYWKITQISMDIHAVQLLYENGQIHCEYFLEKGIPEGIYIEYYYNGGLKKHVNIVNGKFQGICFKYDGINQIDYICNYNYGKLNGKFYGYSRKNELYQIINFKNHKLNGETIKFNYNSVTNCIIKHYCNFKDGKKHGIYFSVVVKNKELINRGIYLEKIFSGYLFNQLPFNTIIGQFEFYNDTCDNYDYDDYRHEYHFVCLRSICEELDEKYINNKIKNMSLIKLGIY